MVHPVIGPHSGPKAALVKFLDAHDADRFDEAQVMLDEWYGQNVFDAYWLGIQFVHEADAGTSKIWRERLNPAGLGVTDGEDQGISYKNGREAARGIMIHHAAYTGLTLPAAWKEWLPLDPRYQLAKDKFGGRVKNWEDYGNGLWATDPQYWQGLLNRYAQVQAYATGDGTMPNIIDRYLHVPQLGYVGVNRRYVGRFGMSPRIIALHIQEGYNLGSWQHFHAVSASSTVLIGQNGDIWRLVPESDAPWTNGDVNGPTAKGWEIINKYGADPNVYSLTIETEGFTGWWPKPEIQINNVVWQIRQWMGRYDIPIENVIRHAEINSVDRRFCPGDAFYNEVIRRIKAQEEPAPPVVKPAAIKIIDPATKLPWTGEKDVTVDNVLYHGERRKVTTVGLANMRRLPTRTAAELRNPVPANSSITVIGWSEGEAVEGENRWWITTNFSRFHVSATKEKPTMPPPPNPTPEPLPGGAKIVKGVAYYPTFEADQEYRELEVRAKGAALRKRADTDSEKVGDVKRGDKVKAAYWCFGERVANERIWWVLVPEDGSDPIANGGRLWVAATTERPE